MHVPNRQHDRVAANVNLALQLFDAPCGVVAACSPEIARELRDLHRSRFVCADETAWTRPEDSSLVFMTQIRQTQLNALGMRSPRYCDEAHKRECQSGISVAAVPNRWYASSPLQVVSLPIAYVIISKELESDIADVRTYCIERSQ